MTKAEKYTLFMETVAADQRHGYSQANRWGTPDYDCSSLVISALDAAGITAKSEGATYTGNMYAVLTKIGFTDVKASVNLATGLGLLRGDILLNDIHHTAVYTGSGKIVHARGQSFGAPAPGDQGQEIAITSYYNYPWDHVLRYQEGHAAPVPRERYAGICTVALAEMVEGSEGPQVKSLQIILNGKGYKGADGKPLDVDGEYGPNTMHAVRQLQKAAGMTGINFGTVSSMTWKALLT